MNLFLYEHITATVSDESSSLFIEGRAMKEALTSDLERIEGVELIHFDPSMGFDGCLQRADAAWVIAPESDGILLDFARRVEQSGKRLIGPTTEAIRLTSDKRLLAQHWLQHGVPTPAIFDGEPDQFPVIVKPVDGCGSQETRRVDRRDELGEVSDRFIVQRFAPGVPCSVAFIDGQPLWPMTQSIDAANGFVYSGGELVSDQRMAEELTAIAKVAVACVPGLHGYVGVDLLLDADSECAVAIEINPRLTTSYVGLRAMTDENLAEHVVFPKRFTSPVTSRGVGAMRFEATGRVLVNEASERRSTI